MRQAEPVLPEVPNATRDAASDSPLRLFIRDVGVLLTQLPAIINAFLPFITRDPLGELYPSPKNVRNWTILAVVSVLEAIFLFAIPIAFLALPGTAFIFGIIAVLLVLYVVCLPLQGDRVVFVAQDPADWQRRKKERWVFVNGIMTSFYGLEMNCERLSRNFGRPIIGVHNRSYGLVYDIIECLLQRCFYLNTTDGRITFAFLREYLRDPSVEKVVLVAHSQGGIIVSLVLDKMFTVLDPVALSKLEVYTFGSAASHFNNPRANSSESQTRRIRHIEHFCNEKDPVTRWGILYNAHKSKYDFQYQGLVFTRRGATGHMFNQHYIDVWFPSKDGAGDSSSLLTPNARDYGVVIEAPGEEPEMKDMLTARPVSRLSQYLGGVEPRSP